MHFDTLALHAGFDPKDHNNAGSVPIYQTSAFAFNSSDEAADVFSLKNTQSYEYTRGSNPTQTVLEKRLNALHGGVGALALGSGVAATFAATSVLVKVGDNFICSNAIYGGTTTQFFGTYKRQGVEARSFDIQNPNSIKKLADKKTKFIFIETLSNPGLIVADIPKIVKIAKSLNLPLIVDNTFATPYLCKPLELGADIVIESASKYTGAHSLGIGGYIVDGGSFDWQKQAQKYPIIAQPNPSFKNINFDKDFGKNGFILACRLEAIKGYGASISPFNSFIFIQGLQTLSLRLEKHSQNAQKLAEFLEKHPKVEKVNYPGLKSNKFYYLCQKQLPKGQGGVFSFSLKGGLESGKKFVESLKIASHQPNLGDSRTLVIHPSSTIHSRLSSEQKKQAGIDDGLVRVSAGLEDVRDLIADFEKGLEC